MKALSRCRISVNSLTVLELSELKYLAALLALAATACSTTAVDLPYSPLVPPTASGVPAIAAVTATDARDEKDPTYIGAVRGGVGNPVDTIVTKTPIADQVKTAFEQALSARHLLGAPGRDTLAIQVTKLSANQTIVRTANAAFRIELRDGAGRILYSDSADVSRSSGYVFGSKVSDLNALGLRAMSEAIDQVLEKPGFLAAVKPVS